MKKTVLLTGLLLALTAPIASAAGLNLSWNNCLPSAPAGSDNFTDALCQTSGNVIQLFGSFVSDQSMADFAADGGRLDMQVAATSLDPWWHLEGGGCRDGALIAAFSGFTNSTSCIKTLGTSFALPPNWTSGPTNRANLQFSASRSSGTVAITPGTEYQVFVLTIDESVSPACGGCSDPACIVFTHLELDGLAGGTDVINLATQQVRNYATWQGGAIGGSGCPAATPTHRATWGEIKSLYR